jgi:hypothetical protein
MVAMGQRNVPGARIENDYPVILEWRKLTLI